MKHERVRAVKQDNLMDIVYIGLKRLSNQNEGHTQAWNALKSLAGAGEILRLSGGRPYFADLRGDFSLSHAGRLAAAAYSVKRSGATGAPLRTACDIERIHPTKDRTPLASRFFHPLEQRWLDGAANRAERQRRFYSLWTLKECFLKAAGSSVFAMKGAPSCVGEAGALKPRIGCGLLRLRLRTYEVEGPGNDRYVFAAALETDREPAEGLWAPPFLPIFKWL